MTDQVMTKDRLFELIDAYGAEPGGWPDDERDAALQLLRAEPETFADALDAARAIDALLAREPVPEPSAALSAAILAQAPSPQGSGPSLFGKLSAMIFPNVARWPAGAALASLTMGLVGGYAYASTGPGYDRVDAAYQAAFGYDTSDNWLSME